jgi:hypothetical protein
MNGLMLTYNAHKNSHARRHVHSANTQHSHAKHSNCKTFHTLTRLWNHTLQSWEDVGFQGIFESEEESVQSNVTNKIRILTRDPHVYLLSDPWDKMALVYQEVKGHC